MKYEFIFGNITLEFPDQHNHDLFANEFSRILNLELPSIFEDSKLSSIGLGATFSEINND
jgi:hypothetical protein